MKVKYLGCTSFGRGGSDDFNLQRLGLTAFALAFHDQRVLLFNHGRVRVAFGQTSILNTNSTN
jgi:hypothetical protein